MEAMQRAIYYLPATAQHSHKLRVAAYCRVSSLSEDQLESYAAQVEHYQQLIECAARICGSGISRMRIDTG